MSQQERVDIVDEQDNVLYQTTKQEAHKKGLLHRTVISEVKDSKGRWILVKQSSDRQDAGQYVSPVGGHIKREKQKLKPCKERAWKKWVSRTLTTSLWVRLYTIGLF